MIDPITEEIRSIRRQLAERDGNDVDRIFQRVREAEQTSGRNYVKLPPRKPSALVTKQQSIVSESHPPPP
jgi:hypothetical protein